MHNRRNIIGLIALFFLIQAQTAAAEVPSHTDTTRTRTDNLTFLAAIDRAASMLAQDAIEIARAPTTIGREDLPLLVSLSGTMALLMIHEDPIRDWVQESDLNFLDRRRSILEPLGRVEVIQLITGAHYLTGHFTNDQRLKRVGVLGWESSVFTAVLTGFFKHTFGRHRPISNKGPYLFKPFSGGNSFPSSHSSQAFSLATVLADEYGSPVSIISYSIASLVALSRMREDLHWASDVFTGALLGSFIAKTLCRIHPSDEGGSSLQSPHLLVTGGKEGISVILSYPIGKAVRLPRWLTN
jgi:hypothetical protein